MRKATLHAVCVALVAFPGCAYAEAPEPVGWGGWYVGGFAGWGDGKLNGPASHESTTGDYDDNGFMAGVLAGYRHQTAENWVLGGEVIVPLHIDKGRAVDKEFFPDQVFYEAKGKTAAMLGINVGRPMGRILPYIHAAAGFARVEGRTLNVNVAEQLTPGFVQKDRATPFIWQVGIGVDAQASDAFVVGGRLGYLQVTKRDYTMPWNAPGPNKFGWSSIFGQVVLSYRFGR